MEGAELCASGVAVPVVEKPRAVGSSKAWPNGTDMQALSRSAAQTLSTQGGPAR